MNEQSRDIFIIDQSSAGMHPGFKIGVLALRNIEGTSSPSELEKMKTQAEENIRTNFANFTREQLNQEPTISAYNKYYKNFDKTYHVRAQVESVLKGKFLPSISGLFDAMFWAEVKNILLTAGHDLDTLALPIRLSVANQEENYIGMKGVPRKTYKKDLFMRDGEGIVSSIISGPDDRTKILPTTKNALFAVYAPAEITTLAM